jgi:hypothetical protein
VTSGPISTHDAEETPVSSVQAAMTTGWTTGIGESTGLRFRA